MPQVMIPRVLAAVTGGTRRFTVAGDTVAAAIEHLLDEYPQLRVHVFDETGVLREHVLCHAGDRLVKRTLDVPVESGETITILQAVSGG